MPGSEERTCQVRWSMPTPQEPLVPDRFEATGEGVINRAVRPIHDGLSLPKTRSIEEMEEDLPRSLGVLFPGSNFRGHQKSANEEKTYSVEVGIKDVDTSDSFLCGYLTIHNLTESYPNLTTFFEAEIIGSKYSFITGKWGANLDADHKHWEQFPYFKENCLSYLYSPSSSVYSNDTHNVVFMRWKERFLVPDHRIEQLSGASYAGFYYVAYDRSSKVIEGYYYHQATNEFQRLFLQHVPSKVSASFEFR